MKLLHLFLSLIYVGIVNAQNSPTLAQASAFATQQKAAFEENKGQVWNTQKETATNVKYHFQQKGIDIFMLPKGMVYQFTKIQYPEGYKVNYKGILSPEEEATQEILKEQIRIETYRMDMELMNANPNATITAEGKSKDYIQYYNRNALDVHSFKKLTYQAVYPGIDWVIYTTEKGLKYDFIVHSGADPSQIKLKIKHHEDLKINADGSFTMSNSMGSITEQAPISFQGTQDISTTFKLDGDIISFNLSKYDPTKSLIIDPNLVWASYYGGASNSDYTNDCLVDDAGNLYLAGNTTSTANIAFGGYQNTLSGGADVFLVKFDSAGVRQFATYYGGTSGEDNPGVGIDAMGNYYLGGRTFSSNNIAFNGHRNTISGSGDAFIVKFNSIGVRQWATYYGGTGSELVGGCAVDTAGNVYIAGRTDSPSGIASNGHQNYLTPMGYCSAFLIKFNTAGVLQWGTYFGGTDDWAEAESCNVDAAGNVYIAGKGSTVAYDFEAFVAKFNPAGTFQWSRYYVTTPYMTFGGDCAIDDAGNVYLVGSHETSNDPNNAFIFKYDSNGFTLWNLSFGGPNFDEGHTCTVDPAGNVYLGGNTYSTSGLALNGHQNTFGGGVDAFLAKFNSAGVPQWASYYGGTGNDEATTCTSDRMGGIYLAGITSSTSNIAYNGHQNTYGGGTDDGFVAKFNFPFCLTSSKIDTQTTCNSYTWIDGNTYTSSNNFATITLTNAAGCDSIITLDLTINNPTTATDIQSACNNYTWIDGNTYTSSNNSATFTGTNASGCDSIITLDLTINNPTTATDIQTACNSYTWIDGNTYTSSNNSATFTLTNTAGCDSLVNLDLTINTVDTTTSVTGTTITASPIGATYQWVDCATNFSPISNATNQSFTPTQNGNYAVIITQNGCVDTSSCHTIIVVGLNDLLNNNNITIYPNPTTENIHIDFGKIEQEANLKLYSSDGKLIQSKTQIQGSLYQLKLPKTTGIYILEVKTTKGISHYKIIKE